MNSSHSRIVAANQVIALLLIATVLISSTGCPALLATGIYVLQGGDLAPAEFEGLKGQRVVVICKQPSSSDFRHGGAARSIAAKVSEKLVKNLKDVDVVNPREVDKWVDESDWGDFRDLAKAVNAEKVVEIELEDFELYKGKTLYQGRSDITITVYDIKDHGKDVWNTHLGEILYPTNSGIPAQDKPVQAFEREFVDILAERVATQFYAHDRNASFAFDSMANR